MAKLDLFEDVLPSILEKATPFVTEENEKYYDQWIVNKALSYHFDCILQVNEMNKLPGLPGLMHYHALQNSTRKYKRKFQKWHKYIKDSDAEAIQEYYHFSKDKAREALAVLTQEQIQQIRKLTDKGGLKKN